MKKNNPLANKTKFFIIAIVFVIACLSLLSNVNTNIAYAETQTGAKAMVVIEAESGRVLLEKNCNQRLPMASTTKIMTALTVLENCKDVNEIVNVSDDAIGIEGTSMYLRKGEKLSVKDLLYGLILPSGNDASVALACHVSGVEEKFVEEMNKLAEKLGCKNTHFANAHGLDAENHYTSAYDLAIISKEALKNPIFLEISQTKNVKVKGNDEIEFRYLKNKNRLLTSLYGCIGVKTGFTDNAGRCFVSAVKRDNMTLICVVLNCPSMFEDSEKLIEECYSKYSMQKLVESYRVVDVLPVTYGEEKNVKAFVYNEFSYPLTKEEKGKIIIKNNLPDNLSAPLEKEQIVGEMQIYLENQLLFSQKIYTMNRVKSMRFKDKFSEVLEKWNI